VGLTLIHEYPDTGEDPNDLNTSDDKRFIWLNRNRFMLQNHAEEHFSTYAGNEGCEDGSFYRRACILISHKDWKEPEQSYGDY
jgi:hypothetical protein